MIRVISKNMFRIISSFLVVCILILGTFTYLGNATVVGAKTVAELQKEQAALAKKEKEAKDKMNNTAAKIKDENKKQDLLNSQIKSVEEQIVIYQNKIILVTADIATKEAEITAKLADIEVNEELFAQRVKAMYINNTSSSILSTLLESKSFSQFINNKEILTRISNSDQDLINSLAEQKKDLDGKKATLLAKQADLKSTKVAFDAKNKSLDTMYDQSLGSEAQLKKDEKRYALEKEQFAKQIKAIEAEVDRIIAESNNSGAGPEGELKWPVPASSRITSPFGWRTIFGRQELHSGVDIGAGKGTAIVAAADGEVILVKNSSYGYGHHLAINHGGGYTTLYAHTSRIDVAVGDKVKRGQVIAGVGSTGNSTGNHLHFEVRINSAKKNPMTYVRKP
ncbi:MAG: peptidoglycan DD-metalloendopeptidase family protein, partial [Oscillospiraceae bacterium]